MKQQELRDQILGLVAQYSKLSNKQNSFHPGITAVPPSGKVIGDRELRFLAESVLDGWFTAGRFNNQFEIKLASYLGLKKVITTNSGSSANLLALTALTSPKLGNKRLSPGDEVITVAAGFPTTVNPIIQNGSVPVFVDVGLPHYNVDVDLIETALSEKTRAIILAHTLGNPFDAAKVREIADEHNLWLIEDCCDALGSTFQGKKVASFGDIATFSFYPAHHITMGEGGAVATDSPRLKKIIESFRDWGRDCYCEPGADNTCNNRYEWKLGSLPEGYDHKYTYSHVGYNLKITDMQAALGLAQLDRLESFIEQRKENFSYLSKLLYSFSDYFVLPEATPGSSPSWFGFPLSLREGVHFSRLELLRYLESKKVGTRLLFAGNITRQPYMKNVNYRISGSLDVTDYVMNNTFWLGIYPGLTSEMLDYVAGCIGNFMKESV